MLDKVRRRKLDVVLTTHDTMRTHVVCKRWCGVRSAHPTLWERAHLATYVVVKIPLVYPSKGSHNGLPVDKPSAPMECVTKTKHCLEIAKTTYHG